jgi:hypothetical protein
LKILVDINIYIDVLTKRAGWEENVHILHLMRKAHEVPKTGRAVSIVARLKAVSQA